MIRDLDKKGLGQNKMLCNSSEVELPWSTTMQAPRQRSLHQGDKSPTTRQLLALEPHRLEFLLVASFLSPLPCHFTWCTSYYVLSIALVSALRGAGLLANLVTY